MRIIQDFPVGLGRDLCERKSVPREVLHQIPGRNNNRQADRDASSGTVTTDSPLHWRKRSSPGLNLEKFI